MMDVERKPTYRQEWSAYHTAQVNEKAHFQSLLHELCADIDDPEQKAGRPRLPLADVIFSATFRIYSTVSCRRFACDLKEAHAKGYLSRLPFYNSIFDYFKMEALTPYLKEMIALSSVPLKAIETEFAVDGSGFSTNRFARWYDVKYGRGGDRREWVKAHLMCGVRTNIVTSVEVSGGERHDSPYFADLLDGTIKSGFTLREVSADKGYDSYNNRRLALVRGAVPYIPFRALWKPDAKKGELWSRVYHLYSFHRDEFNRHYCKRSNVESTFSMIKIKFGERLRSKTETAQRNEVLCKVLAHNLCVVIQSMYELGVEPAFRAE